MRHELTTIREDGASAKEIVGIVRETYPRFDRALLSKVEHGDQTGIDLRTDAMEAVRAAFSAVATPTGEPNEASAIKQSRPDNRRLKNRIYGRLGDQDYKLLLKRIKANGFDTVQDWIVASVAAYTYFDNLPEDEEDGPKCPICGRLCDTIYRDRHGVVGGCENCVTLEASFDAPECWKENIMNNKEDNDYE